MDEGTLSIIGILADIGTSIGTLALAYVTYLTLKEHKPKIRVSSRYGDLGEEDRDFSKPIIIFTALNKGQVTVFIENFELWIENIQRVPISCYLLEDDRCDAFECDQVYTLAPGRKIDFFIDLEHLDYAISRTGYENHVRLCGIFFDQTGSTYSGSYDL